MMSVRRRKKSDAPPRQQPAKLKPKRRAPQPRPAPQKSARNERTNQPVDSTEAGEVKLDAHGLYAAACLELAVSLGHAPGWVFNLWSQLARIRMARQRLPQAAAEQSAMRDIKASLDKRDTQENAS